MSHENESSKDRLEVLEADIGEDILEEIWDVTSKMQNLQTYNSSSKSG